MIQVQINKNPRVIVLPFDARIRKLFPHAKDWTFKEQRFLVMPHGQDETRMLRNLDYPIPAPITQHYNFPGPPFAYDAQKRTAAALTMHPRFFCLNGMGTGKTLSCLWAFDWLRSQRLARKMLVVCPKSTVHFTWDREIGTHLPWLKTAVLTGKKERRLAALKSDAHVYIINHHGVRTIEKELMREPWDVICFDEAAVYRNARAEMSKSAQKLMRSRKWVWGLTGSPTPNAPTDAFGLARLITPEKAPKSFVHFRQETMIEIDKFTWRPRKDAAETIAKILQPSTRFTLDEIVELPDVVERHIDVDLGTRQSAIYAELRDRMAAQLKEGTITPANGGVVLGKLLQVAAGYVYLDDGRYASLDPDERIEAMLDTIEGTPGKTIVFSPWIHTVKAIDEVLTKEGIDHRNVSGSTPMGERTETFNLFQNTDQIRVLNAHPGCMAHGLTLTAADTIIWYAPIQSLEIFEQANARIRRIGQKRKQQVIMLQACAAERRTYQRLRSKHELQESVLDILAEIAAG